MPIYRGRVPDATTLGAILQQARMARGLTQRQFADALGISQRYVWEIEAGKPTLYAERLFRALRMLNVTLSAEFAEPDPPLAGAADDETHA
ncbi:helix-turn-helix protein [Microcella alkaliphila]|uniref:Helix-turn-helix protein n=1 Tax=Microcella alkaliphila TaxID=279828 RepID=A0A4V2FME2_9MICO|nr:helix-turn-helix domain-containing protein [Microcella alkaliphila]RZT57469.1 helix-turn-helix protein [Microcella alkaliphila]